MKKQKFTVHFYEVVSCEQTVEATSYEEALDLATDGSEVVWESPVWVQNNKTGTVKDFTNSETEYDYED